MQTASNTLLCFLYIATVSLLAVPDTVFAADTKTQQQAFELFSSEDYLSASEQYARITGFSGRLGEGASHYRLQDYNNAIIKFSQAVLDADNNQQRATALYNLGNSYFQTGQYAISVQVFSDALQYQPDHTPARHNLEASLHLKQLVEKRVRLTFRPPVRPGRGPRTANFDRSISPGQSDVMPDSEIPPVDDSNQTDTTEDENIEALIQKGLQHIRLASGESAETDDTAAVIWQQQDTPVQLTDISEDRGRLWKRLFEIEEGYDAPATEPKTLPGITPW